MQNAYDIKIFQINKNHFEIRNKSFRDIILEIIRQHKLRLNINESNDIYFNNGQVHYCSYVFNEDEKSSHWKNFLVPELVAGHDFRIKKISFVLFCSFRGKIFAVVGGSGMRVIKKFLNDRFGLDLYERFLSSSEDIIISHISRGILGNLSENRKVYRIEKRLNEAFDVTDVPTKIVIKLRNEIKDSIFEFIDFKSNSTLLEVGSYFYVKIKIDFDILDQLIQRFADVLELPRIGNLTSFSKIEDEELISKHLEINLFNEVLDDLANRYNPNPYGINFPAKDIDFIHPSNLMEFYECDKYEIEISKFKVIQATVNNREEIYPTCLSVIHEKIGVASNLYDFIKYLRRIRIKGYRNDELKTNAKFFDHLTSEVKYNEVPYFKIDNNWYQVEPIFIKNINSLCETYYKRNLFVNNHLFPEWKSGVIEGVYNRSFRGKDNFYVFDKLLNDNIELCDLLYIDDTSKIIYLIHVKDGFDAKMRDLYNQIILSSQRLMNDLKNSRGADYLEGQVRLYNNSESTEENPILIDFKELLFKMNSNTYQKSIVMAFKSKSNMKNTFPERVGILKSNIAKYALVQTVKEIEGFGFYVIDLADY